jgi:Tripartite tricarboxylate transporter family receptor
MPSGTEARRLRDRLDEVDRRDLSDMVLAARPLYHGSCRRRSAGHTFKSPYYMHELFDVWRNCREDADTFINRTRVLFKAMTGVDMSHIPYRADVFSDLISGQVQVYFGAMAASIEYIRAGRLRALAVTSATRSCSIRDRQHPGRMNLSQCIIGDQARAGVGPGCVKTKSDLVVAERRMNFAFFCSERDRKPQNFGCGRAEFSDSLSQELPRT